MVQKAKTTKPNKASAKAISKKTFKSPDKEVFTSTHIEKSKQKSNKLMFIYIAILIIGILLGFALTSQTNCEVADKELSACYDGCEFSDLPSYEYNKCTLFCKTTHGSELDMFCSD